MSAISKTQPQAVAGLFQHGIGIWPTQLPRYAEAVSLANNAPEDTSVPRKAIHEPQSVIFGDWRELVHPLGGTYYYNNNKNAYTSANLRNYQYLQMLDDFVDASRASAKEDSWVLVVQPALFLGEQRFQYYYVVPNCRTIAWLEDLNGILLFRECIKPSEWGHKKLELEAQYWKHFEFFPHHFQMVTSEVRGIWREVICYLSEVTILSQSTAASIFWTLDDMSLIITQLANIEELAEHDLIPETGIVFCCRILYMLWHHQYLNRHNQPEAWLIQTHAVRERPRKYKFLSWMANVAATMLCMPITIERIRSTSVDGIINGVEVQMFVDDFSSQTKSQITLAGVSMALYIAILAIPGLGTTAIAQMMCSCSFLLGVGCIFAGTMVQHFCERMRSFDFAAYYLRKRTIMLVVITSIPTCFCVLSVSGSILGFLAGVSIDFKPSTPLVISCFASISIVVGSLLIMVFASYGPGLVRAQPQ